MQYMHFLKGKEKKNKGNKESGIMLQNFLPIWADLITS